MTIGQLWLPVLGAPGPSFDPFSLQASGTFTTAALSNPQTLTLPSSYSTALNDCIVVAIAVNSASALSMSGAGATWVSVGQTQNANFNGQVFVGYAASAGQTTCSLSGATASADAVLAVFSDVKSASSPVHGTNHTGSNTASGIQNPGATSYGATGLFLATGFLQASGWAFTGGGSPVWGGPGGTTQIGLSNTHMSARLDAVVPTPAVAGSATFGYNLPGTAEDVLVNVSLDHP